MSSSSSAKWAGNAEVDQSYAEWIIEKESGWQHAVWNAQGSGAPTRRMEGGMFDPRLSTAAKLADTLQVRVEWLLTGDEPMLSLAQMTVDEQHKAQSGPGTEGLPGYVVVGPGPRFTDDEGEWRVETDD